MTIPTRLQEKLAAYEGRFPVPVVALAHDFGIEVYATKDLGERQSGMIAKEGDAYVIYVNERHPATRKIFTIAHEIAHFVQHKDFLDRGERHVDSIDQPVGNGDVHARAVLHRQDGATLTDEERQRESEANALAAEILMPKEAFERAFKNAGTIDEVAQKFGVSPAAAAIRAKSLLGEVIF